MEKEKAKKILKYIYNNPGVSRQEILNKFELNSNSFVKLLEYNSHKIETKLKDKRIITKDVHGNDFNLRCTIHTYEFKGKFCNLVV